MSWRGKIGAPENTPIYVYDCPPVGERVNVRWEKGGGVFFLDLPVPTFGELIALVNVEEARGRVNGGASALRLSVIQWLLSEVGPQAYELNARKFRGEFANPEVY